MRNRNTLIAAAVLLTGTALGTAARAEQPAAAANGEWLSLSGEIRAVNPHEFILDYGSKTIPVEMDSYGWYDEDALLPGDNVTVTGKMDDDFFEIRKIEASSVYVDSLHEMFYANPADEEDPSFSYVVPSYLTDDVGGVTLSGEVRAIKDQIVTLDAGLYDYKVDTGTLEYNPFDSEGLERIDVGDEVLVSGTMDSGDLFDTRELDAQTLTTLSEG